MQYSEFPHESYLDQDGKGPGAAFAGDIEKWNWRYLLRGTEVDDNFDYGLEHIFNDAQRSLMQREPLEAAEALDTFIDKKVMEGVWQRAQEAHDRLFPPLIASIKDNVIHANFRRK